MTKFTKSQKATVVALIGIGLFNPASVEILNEYFKMFYTGVFIGCVVIFSAIVLKNALTPEKVNVPKKSAKTKKQEYIED